MRLNLRLLLDYLDDRLDPETTGTLGAYLAEHEKPRQLVDHMRRVVRRRRLSTPDVAERSELPPQYQDDPNFVASYLDGQLTPEQEAAFEEICLDTDVYLAEVTASHQILALGEAGFRVPPLARQRMYGLVQGPEAQPLRIVPREPRKSNPPLWEVDGRPGYEEENQGLLEPLYHDLAASRWRKILPAAAVILMATLIGLVLWNLPKPAGTVNLEIAEKAKPAPVAIVQPKDQAPEVIKPVAAAPRLQAQAVWPMPVILTEGQPAWQAAPQAVGAATGMVAARPAMLGMFLSLGQETPRPEPVVPLPKVEVDRNAVPPPQRDVHMQLGLNAADVPGMFLHPSQTGEWSFLRPQAGIISNEMLMALPGYTGSIALQTQVRLTLVGQFAPNISSNPYAEAVVELHPTPDADLDVTLHRGRLAIAGRPAAPDVKVRLRYQGETWELTLQPNTEIGIQAFGKILPGEDDPWQLAYRLEMVVGQGTAEVKKQGQIIPLGPKSQFVWTSRGNDGQPGILSEVPEAPAWITKHLTAPKEAVNSLVAFRSRVQAKLTGDGKDQTWLRLACEESLEERQLVERQEAVLIQAALDNLAPLVRSLSDQNNERRKIAREVLIYWLGQHEDRAASLINQLIENGYTQEDAKLLLALYRGPSQVTPALIQALLQRMNHPQLAIRDQAWQVLTVLMPERPTVYDPTTSEELRTKSIEVIKSRIAKPLKQSDGSIPPPP